MSKQAYIFLNLLNLANFKINNILCHFGDRGEILKADKKELSKIKGLTSKDIEKIESLRDSKFFENELDLIKKEKVTCLSLFDKDYPEDRLEMYSTVGGTPHLDDAYTVFGRVVEGLDVLEKIAAVETAGRDKPVEDVFMIVEVEKIGEKKLKKQYGTK